MTKDWSSKDLCFECAKRVGARINIGQKLKGRCHRCHSEQTLFKVTEMPAITLPGDDICPECAHPTGTHAATCRRSEAELLRRERREIVELLNEFAAYDPGEPLAGQLRRLLQTAKSAGGGEGPGKA